MELIDKDFIKKLGGKCIAERDEETKELLPIIGIDCLPTVDAEPVRHGQWDYVTVVDEGFWRCSNCGTPSEAIGAKKLYKYCPFCGAKMREEDGH